MEKSTGRKNGNNVQTSVIIDLANQEEQEEQKIYNVDFNDVKTTPKDYVLDQIFCGDNITVYALFEIPDISNGATDQKLGEVTNLSVNDDFRFYHKNSYKKVIGEKGEDDSKAVVDCEENVEVLAVKDNKNESFYCLKQYEVPRLGDDNQELKVLFSKDVIPKNLKSTKTVSKGVNTDIAQCPKLLDEVHRALNFPFPISQGNAVEVTSFPPAFDVVELDARPSSSSYSHVEAREFPPPNFVVVPLIMMEEGMLSQMQQKPHMSMDNKIPIASIKTSVGTNTESGKFSLTEEKEKIKEKAHPPDNSSKGCQQKDKKEEELLMREGKKENQEEEPKHTTKETILEEVKNLQRKLNALIKSLESKDFHLNLKKEEVEDRDPKPSIKKLQPENLQIDWKSQNKFGHLSTFPPLKLSPSNKLSSMRTSRQKPNSRGEKKKLPIVRFSASIDSLVRDSVTHNGCEDAKVVINWKNMIKWRKVGESKSESNNRFAVSDPKHTYFHPLKKSVSLDLREEKLETFGIKRMRNATLKLEGNLKAKANIRLKLNGETFFGDNMAFLNCEMGDEASSIIKSLQLNLSDLVGVADTDVVKDSSLKCSKVEGDSSLYQKHGLISPKFTDKLAVHYCSANANTAISDSYKSEKNSTALRKKSRTIEKSVEKVVEKSKIPNRSFKFAVPEVKKEVGQGSKATEKSLKKEMIQEIPKPKSVSANRKPSTVRGIPEVKSLNKTTKKASHESKEYVNGQKLLQGKYPQDEKFVGKGDAVFGRSLRPPSQKRQSREKESITLDFNNANSSPVNGKRSVLVSEGEMEQLGDEEEMSLLGTPILLSSRNPSSVIFELFNKKPVSLEEFNFENEQEFMLIQKTPTESVSDEKDFLNTSTSNENNENNESSDKPIVKSVWALTKVLLYEDGTKKFEVLEASLTPPEYCLTGEKTTASKSR